MTAKKQQFPPAELPKEKVLECTDCFDSITKKSNEVLNKVRLDSDLAVKEVLHAAESLVVRAMDQLSSMNEKVDAHYERQSAKYDIIESKMEEKNDKMDEKFTQRYDLFEKKASGIIWKALSVVIIIIGMCATIVGATWVAVQNKAESESVTYIDDYLIIRGLSDRYIESSFIKKPNDGTDSVKYYQAFDLLIKKRLVDLNLQLDNLNKNLNKK